MSTAFQSVAVMGAGAVGCYFGGMLARAGASVTLIGRQATVDAITRDGLVIESARFPGRVRVAATTDAAGVARAGLVLFAVKSNGTESAAAAMAPHLAPDAVVLVLQNGVDNFERLRARLANPIVPAVVYVAAEIIVPGVMRHNGRGDLVIGTLKGSGASDRLIATLAAAFGEAQIPVRISDNIEGELWAKLVLNCAYNAISALGRSRYGPMMAMPEVRQVVRDAVIEMEAVARANGVCIAMDDPVEATLKFADAMPGALSSTAQDLVRGRATEIEHLNGYIVREADAHGIAAPVNRTLYALVMLAEQAQRG